MRQHMQGIGGKGFLASFGVHGMGDVERLGIKGPYMGEFEEIFAAS